MTTLEKYYMRLRIHAQVMAILTHQKNPKKVITLLEEPVSFIEAGDFVQDITLTSKGALKSETFFKEKSELINIIKALPDDFKKRTWKIFFGIMERMLPLEKDKFWHPCPSAWPCEHDRQVVRNLQGILKKDLLETKEFLTVYCKNTAIFDHDEVGKLLHLIPDDKYLSHDATIFMR